MNLTSYVSNKVVRNRIRQVYDRPEIIGKREPLVSQISTDSRLIGTAFDYLLRFYVERLNPGTVATTWIAENVGIALTNGSSISVQVSSVRSPSGRGMCAVYGYSEQETVKTARKVREVLEQARAEHQSYINGRPLRRELLISCCALARLDWLFRSTRDATHLYFPSNWDTYEESELIELQQLIEVVDPGIFKATNRCVVNPRFRTNLLQADADLLIDDRIIEIKVVSRHLQDQRDWDQLLGYYALYRHGGIEDVNRNVRIRRLGLYSARFANYQEIKFATERLQKIEKLTKWLIDRLQKERAL